MPRHEEDKIRAVIFDVGGVYLRGSRNDIFSRLSKEFGIDFEFIKNQLNEFYTELEDNGYFWTKIADRLKQKDHKIIRKIWLETVEKKFVVNKKVRGIIENIKKSNRIKVAALTDTNKVHSVFIERMGYYKVFDVVILSSDVGIKKPDIRIYKLATKRLCVRPEECIYIDDKEKNLIPAEKLGMKTVLFRNAEQLKNNLKKFEI